jgi:hypothetical protein
MVLAADYPFLDIFWSMIIFFAWLAWFWMIIVIFGDIFRRRDIGGWSKALWIAFMIILPFLGVLVYLIAQHKGMADRNLESAQLAQQQFDDRVRSVAAANSGGGGGGGAAQEIAQAQELLKSGAIDQSEFDRLKAKALG